MRYALDCELGSGWMREGSMIRAGIGGEGSELMPRKGVQEVGWSNKE